MDLIRKEEMASQVLAVIRGGFQNPSPDDEMDILKRATERVEGEIRLQASQGLQQPV
jgi:hypothetical protein